MVIENQPLKLAMEVREMMTSHWQNLTFPQKTINSDSAQTIGMHSCPTFPCQYLEISILQKPFFKLIFNSYHFFFCA